MSKPRKVTKPAETKSSTGVVLKSILPKDMTDKAARRKLRAAGLGFHSKRERWTFTPAQAAKAKEILTA